jgi:hypothetical protein
MASFAQQVSAWSDKARNKVTLAHRKIAMDVFSEVILMSPVDTGRFRGNWQCQIGSIPIGTLELDDRAGTATISRMQAEALKVEAGQVIYLVNNLPYAQRLEFGYSQQAPAGMVRLTVQRYRPIVEAVARELSKI